MWRSQSSSSTFNSTSQSGRNEPPHVEEVDILLKGGHGAVEQVVLNPPAPQGWMVQKEIVLMDNSCVDGSHVELAPNAVLVNIYDLNQRMTRANDFLAFSMDKLAVGGIFHVGVEVFGAEWSYGMCGVTAEPPRTTTSHVYNCSIQLGNTNLEQTEFAGLIHAMCQAWHGAQYDILSHNCCSFATDLCEHLQVGQMPPWINRFARLLHRGRAATKTIVSRWWTSGADVPPVNRNGTPGSSPMAQVATAESISFFENPHALSPRQTCTHQQQTVVSVQPIPVQRHQPYLQRSRSLAQPAKDNPHMWRRVAGIQAPLRPHTSILAQVQVRPFVPPYVQTAPAGQHSVIM